MIKYVSLRLSDSDFEYDMLLITMDLSQCL